MHKEQQQKHIIIPETQRSVTLVDVYFPFGLATWTEISRENTRINERVGIHMDRTMRGGKRNYYLVRLCEHLDNEGMTHLALG